MTVTTGGEASLGTTEVSVMATVLVKMGVKVNVGVGGIGVGEGVWVLVSVEVGVFVGVVVAVEVLVGVGVDEAVGIGVGLLVGVLVGVAVAARAVKSLIWLRPIKTIMSTERTIPRPTLIIMVIVCLLTVGNNKEVSEISR